MNAGSTSGLSALGGSLLGGLASIVATWLAEHYQSLANRGSQDTARLEKQYSDFINLASKLYTDAQSHNLEDATTLAPLYALKSQVCVFARSKVTVDRAEEVMQRIVDTYHQPNHDFQNHQSVGAVDHDVLRGFTVACRAELVADR